MVREDLSILGASKITVPEGLPNPFHDEMALAARAGPRQRVERAGYPFYHDPLPINDALDRPILIATLGDEATYRRFRGEKKCGGFHPDFAVGWLDGIGRRTALICFICREVMVIEPDTKLRYNITPEASKRLATVLEQCRRRPSILSQLEIRR